LGTPKEILTSPDVTLVTFLIVIGDSACFPGDAALCHPEPRRRRRTSQLLYDHPSRKTPSFYVDSFVEREAFLAWISLRVWGPSARFASLRMTGQKRLQSYAATA
jgi:hypothetical protein